MTEKYPDVIQFVKDTLCEDVDWGYCRPESMAIPGCTDYPPSWTDSEGDACYIYKSLQFCTEYGEMGEGWSNDWGDFESFTRDGFDASDACCACGGGSYSNQGFNGLWCTDRDEWTDTDGDGCQSYSNNNWCLDDCLFLYNVTGFVNIRFFLNNWFI